VNLIFQEAGDLSFLFSWIKKVPLIPPCTAGRYQKCSACTVFAQTERTALRWAALWLLNAAGMWLTASCWQMPLRLSLWWREDRCSPWHLRKLLRSKIKCEIRVNSATASSVTGQPASKKRVKGSCEHNEACSH